MATENLLSQEEIDALLSSVATGEIVAGKGVNAGNTRVRAFDFTAQNQLAGGRLPRLALLNERFAATFSTTLFNTIKRPGQVVVRNLSMETFADYLQGLEVPASINFIAVKPLRGEALVVLESALLYAVVDNFYGGKGALAAPIERVDFTQAETRMAQMLLRHLFVDMAEAWSTVIALEFDVVRTEINPDFANKLSPGEQMLVTTFDIDFDGVGGALQVALPYAMIEPIRDRLDNHLQADDDTVDEHWRAVLKEELTFAEVTLSSTLARTQLTLRELLLLDKGDVIAIDVRDTVTLCAEGVPVFHGEFGAYKGKNAIKIRDRAPRPGQHP